MISDLTRYLTVPQSTCLISNTGLNDSLVESWTLQKHKKGNPQSLPSVDSCSAVMFLKIYVNETKDTYGGKSWKLVQFSNSQNSKVARIHLKRRDLGTTLISTSPNSAICHSSPSGKIRAAQNLAAGLV